jgi:hypothetical protein
MRLLYCLLVAFWGWQVFSVFPKELKVHAVDAVGWA